MAIRIPARAAGSRAVVRDASWCGDRWWVVGATSDARGNTRPAAWSSADGTTWRPVPLHPGDDYYAAVRFSARSAARAIAWLPSARKSGGAHGNPRVQTWRQLADGSLAAVVASNEQYGGQDTVSVARLSGGSSGYLVTGTRLAGASVWSSATGARFTLHDSAPGLASTPSVSTQARDAVRWDGSWTVAGDAVQNSGRLVATVWSGAGDGPWTPTSLPGGTHLTTGDRVTLAGEGPVVAGLDDTAFAVWSERDGRWTQESRFGAQDAGSTSPAFVSGLAWTGNRLVATYGDGARYLLVVGTPASLSQVAMPTAVPDEGDDSVTVASHGDDVLLLTDDGHAGRVWLTHLQ